MTECGDYSLLSEYFIAERAMAALCKTCFRTGCRFTLIIYDLVLELRNNFLLNQYGSAC